MAKKRKVKGKKIFILLFVCVILIISLMFVFKHNKKKPLASEVEVIDSIDNFSYQLNDNETKYYNELFSNLKELLSSDDYSEEDYASIIGKLFLADFYDLNSKVMKSDVGGTQFVYEPYRGDFELGAIDTIYKFVESNVYGDRKQNLPVVKSVDVTNISNGKYSYGSDTDTNAFYLDFNIVYEKDLGYPSTVSLVLVHVNDKLEIVEME
ncbi:MAG: hypothetical protein J6D28_00725 [Bacilli bacterium]|nr:hypothetical protein [Bacilli bacterium]